MPASNKSRIPREKWEQHKDRIIDLYINQGITLSGVIDTMKSEGFFATRNQYEVQLRGWNVHKNMTEKSWDEVFSREETSEINLSGQRLPNSRVMTARALYGPSENQVRERGTNHVTMPNNGPVSPESITYHNQPLSEQDDQTAGIKRKEFTEQFRYIFMLQVATFILILTIIFGFLTVALELTPRWQFPTKTLVIPDLPQ
ncbi:hypothetical protein F4806DRAFT_436311 [Annulohypoxylon nitens]|nr:hypothetical protein F4806DRAFT_436311 [Annulohypoxylon nitens]